MSVAEIKAEIAKLSPAELNQLWQVIEDALDHAEADAALAEPGELISAEDLKKKLGL